MQTINEKPEVAKKVNEKKGGEKEQDNPPIKKGKQPQVPPGKKDVDEQSSDGSGGAFGEFIDQQDK